MPLTHRARDPFRGSAGTWLAAYVGLVVLPLAVALGGSRPAGGGWWWDFSLALGYAGLGMMGVQFALTARFRRAAAPFGIDLVYYFHRDLATIAFVLLALHAAIIAVRHPGALGGVDPRTAPLHLSVGWLALIGFGAVLVTSWWRRGLGIEYDRWRRWHLALAVASMGLAVAHVEGSANYLFSPIKRSVWLALLGAWAGLVVWVRLLRPWRLARRPWRVVEVRRERGRSWTLALVSERAQRFAFDAGQFAWLTLGASPFAMREHPFSISSSPAEKERIEFTIKELGDFTETIGSTQVGERAYVDGPYGAFCVDRHPGASALGFVAGGVGIAPVISMLRTLAARGDRRPMLLFYGNRCWDRVVFREELESLRARLDLAVVHVLLEPPPDWQGESGYVTREVIARHAPCDEPARHWFVCGPNPMLRLVESALAELGVDRARVHSELFDLA